MTERMKGLMVDDALKPGTFWPTLDAIGKQIPAAHRDFIRNLPAVYEEPDLFVVHGKWDPDEFAESPNLTTRLHERARSPTQEQGEVGRHDGRGCETSARAVRAALWPKCASAVGFLGSVLSISSQPSST